MSKVLPPAIFLMGPTASGKTDLALQLVRDLPCEIISVDSAMVYRGMDIGTAKPDKKILQNIPHRLIDICDPGEPYSAARFREDALQEMMNISSSGKIPLLVGGTMLYFRTLQRGISELPGADQALRTQLEEEAMQSGWDAMHARLIEVDAESASRIHPNDPQRIQRALEVYQLTGRCISEHYRTQKKNFFPYRLVKIAISPRQRTVLHQRIEQRFHLMLKQGFIDEVKRLFQRDDLNAELPSMRAVGYRQAWAYLCGECDCQTMAQRSIIATRQLAKRQLTWLRAEQDIRWLETSCMNEYQALLKLLAENGICAK